MKVKVYLKNNDPEIEEVLEMENIRPESVIGFKSMQIFAATGMMSFTTLDGSRWEIIPREMIERITCLLEDDISDNEMPSIEEISDEDMEEFEIDIPDVDIPDGQEEMDFLLGGDLEIQEEGDEENAE